MKGKETNMDYKQQVKAMQPALIEDIKALCAIDSVYDAATVADNAPFGAGCRKALDAMLALGAKDGYTTHDVDGYAGDIEVGGSEEGICILGHLDVVPVQENEWITPPFTPTIRDGKLYARGTSDDKGPLLAAYYAAKLFHRNYPDCSKKIRIIFGCNEERGSSCVKHYFEKMPACEMGFTPDADFPVIYGEKGTCGIVIGGKYAPETVLEIHGGTVANIVPQRCEAILAGTSPAYREALDAYLQKRTDVTAELEAADTDTRIVMHGQAAHASTPHLGVNAIAAMCEFLSTVCDSPLTALVADKLMAHDGAQLGIEKVGQLGALTMNLGILHYDGEQAQITLDLRIPHEIDAPAMAEQVRAQVKAYGADLNYSHGRALIIDKDSKLIRVLDEAYREEEPNGEGPQAIGGGTYAKAATNCAAFGPSFPGEDTHIHDSNEFIDLVNLERATAIFYRAIEKLML